MTCRCKKDYIRFMNRTEYVIKLIYDKEVNVWIARNDDIPLALEDKSFENL